MAEESWLSLQLGRDFYLMQSIQILSSHGMYLNTHICLVPMWLHLSSAIVTAWSSAFTRPCAFKACSCLCITTTLPHILWWCCYLRLHSVKYDDDLCMINWQGIGRGKSWCNWGIITALHSIFLQVLRKAMKHLWIMDNLYEIQARYLLNTNPEHYCYTILFRNLNIGSYASCPYRFLSCFNLQANAIVVISFHFSFIIILLYLISTCVVDTVPMNKLM